MKIFIRALLLACLSGFASIYAAEMNDTPSSSHLETAVFGGGCFWCLDAQFKLVKGVKSVVSGYAGGTTKNPSYEQVCTETTGHAEVIQVEFDPAIVTYADLLRKFFPIILYRDANQKAVAEEVKKEVQKDWPDPIVTQIVPLQAFYQAEDYHQDYFAKNPTQGYCRVVVAPKVKKFEKMLQEEKH